MRYLSVLLLIGLLNHASTPKYINGKVTKVYDGDTITIDGKHRIRFEGIDCPEIRQPHGLKAKIFTTALIYEENVTIKIKEKDRYGRLVGEVFFNGESINRELVRYGHAWWYEKYAKKDLDLSKLQESAKMAKRGLWSNETSVAPWVYRKL